MSLFQITSSPSVQLPRSFSHTQIMTMILYFVCCSSYSSICGLHDLVHQDSQIFQGWLYHGKDLKSWCHNNDLLLSSCRANEGPTLKTTALEILYGGQFTLFSCRIGPSCGLMKLFGISCSRSCCWLLWFCGDPQQTIKGKQVSFIC